MVCYNKNRTNDRFFKEVQTVRKLVFHIDVNSAFLSWEAAKRVAQGEADLRLVPSAIGCDREKRTGVILAKSIPAKKCGVKTGEPVAQALRKCPDLILARPDFRLYEQNSRAFTAICARYAPVVEKYSIDECFLDMSGTERLYPDYREIAHRLRTEIREELGFTVNIGISTNKLLAKMASDFEKPDRVHTLFPDEIRKKMWPLPVGDLFSVGAATATKLTIARIKTIGDLARTDLAAVKFLVGDKLGEQIHRYANGIDDSPVLAEAEDAKGYSNSTTLEEDITAEPDAFRVLLALADSVSTRMRADGKTAGCVAVTIRGDNFRDRSHRKKLDEPTDITAEIYRVACRLFSELWDRHTPIRLLGVALTQINAGPAAQLSLFPDAHKEKTRKLDQAVDTIRSRFGHDTIAHGSLHASALEVGKKHRAQMEAE